MSQFFESIKLLDGKLQLLDLHNQRLNTTRNLFFENCKQIDLLKEISIPCDFKEGLVKVRIEYAKYLQRIDFLHYEIKNHNLVKIVANEDITYEFKATNRSMLDTFLNSNPKFDDVIFVKNGFLTDASYSNLALFNGKVWVTPSHCLFKGLKRASLLSENRLQEKDISLKDLHRFEKIAFINSMRDFEKIYTFVFEEDELKLAITE